MALPSSGQISLNDIATEFGGTAPHALSEYYGDGNAPASGEIQIGADFYGTSAVTYLLNTTMTVGTRVIKTGLDQDGYTSGASDTNSGQSSIGSMGTTTLTSGQYVKALYMQDESPQSSGIPDQVRLYLSTSATNWTQLFVQNTSNSTSLLLARTSAGQQAVQRSSTSFLWSWNLSGNTAPHPFVPNNTITIQIT